MINIDRFLERKRELAQATLRLQEACEQPFNPFIRDAVIQRFEFCWELAWKTLRLWLEYLGVETLSPRDT
ncbi:MAG: nucleotidyltransferase substrate binding protein, partial [Candidatus Binatia bacterium]